MTLPLTKSISSGALLILSMALVIQLIHFFTSSNFLPISETVLLRVIFGKHPPHLSLIAFQFVSNSPAFFSISEVLIVLTVCVKLSAAVTEVLFAHFLHRNDSYSTNVPKILLELSILFLNYYEFFFHCFNNLFIFIFSILLIKQKNKLSNFWEFWKKTRCNEMAIMMWYCDM